MNNLGDILSENVKKDVSEAIVSVIIATYRREAELKRALQSLTQQTYKNIEIIVVDDNAEDKWNKKVKDIIEEICIHHPIIYIQNKANKGSAETRNIGIRRAVGSYITFLDDDDVYLPNKIKNQIDHMIANSSDYCITDLDLYDENEKLIEKRTRKYIKEKNVDDLLRYHLMHHITGTDSLMFKRNYLLSIGGFPPINVGDEFYLMQKAIEAGGKFSYLPVCDIKAYVHTDGESLSSGESKINGENALFENKKQFFDRLSNSDIRYIKMRHYAVLAFAYFRLKKKRAFIYYAVKSVLSSPVHCIELLINRK